MNRTRRAATINVVVFNPPGRESEPDPWSVTSFREHRYFRYGRLCQRSTRGSWLVGDVSRINQAPSENQYGETSFQGDASHVWGFSQTSPLEHAIRRAIHTYLPTVYDSNGTPKSTGRMFGDTLGVLDFWYGPLTHPRCTRACGVFELNGTDSGLRVGDPVQTTAPGYTIENKR